ncbi:hypothetical protein FUA23_00335 [Neolewinella aurantiaca]|uniref:Uncharacterized protein n=1 Tax=Neolewinella aurantiaca TaxID=2602767 RepID=A0A5C7FN77_9BACT|nr:hypothetical protein [Neolewinella aurantiaca]TXF91665.1 hypothetical protein FUA23_00335 [Neolewinella aurantiaca]
MIDSVSNYCHRWCERCPFTSRCSLVAFSEEHMSSDQRERPGTLPASFPALSGKFSEFLGRLELNLQKYRNSLSVIGYGAREEYPRPTGMSRKALGELSMTVMLELRELRKGKWVPDYLRSPDFGQADVQAFRELNWYLGILGPKFRRAVLEKPYSGPVDLDAHKTARLTHIILARMIAAITVLIEVHGREAYDDLRTILEDCLRLLAGIRSLFPEAYLYHRPGFDDPAERGFLKVFYEECPPVDPFKDGTWSPGGRAPSA